MSAAVALAEFGVRMELDGAAHARVVAATSVDTRLENWAAWARTRLGLGQADSLEGGYRSKQWGHWDDLLGEPPSTRRPVDVLDAFEVEGAVCRLHLFHHLFLKGHFVQMWRSEKVLNVAYRYGLEERTPRHPAYDANLAMSRAQLIAELAKPAAVRKPRAQAMVDAIMAKEAASDASDPVILLKV